MKDKETYQETIYNAICDKLGGLDYILCVDMDDVPVIATTKEGYCFYVKVEPCPYDWTKEVVETELKNKK